jgi:hypothetical protein
MIFLRKATKLSSKDVSEMRILIERAACVSTAYLRDRKPVHFAASDPGSLRMTADKIFSLSKHQATSKIFPTPPFSAAA